ncbi:DUF4232 domain-containing protein [Streptomyces cadmiisoli]|uniref:DUF4232 domain-containing protein n=1 Tax=Streptomyces cadmiisoli TaxID=2184053 RepID=UPI00365C109D
MRPRHPRHLPRRFLVPASVLVLLLSACGTQQAAPHDGGSNGCPTVPPPDPYGSQPDDVRITGFAGAGCDEVEYEVTNGEPEPFTYTVTFDLRTGSGAVLSNLTETVPGVAAGRTVRRTLALGSQPSAQSSDDVRISLVRSVPADEAPAEPGRCPSSGVRLYADRGDAAMGLRVVGLHLENCGTEPYRLHGYPRLRLLDEDHEPVDGVRILRGGDAIALGTGDGGPPEPLVLRPGERAASGLVWRNTVEAGEPVDAPYVRIRAKPGADAVTVTPELDLGTTGRLGVHAWRKADTGPPASGAPAQP